MDENGENARGLVRPAGHREMGNRRALREIKNLVGGVSHPLAAAKRDELTGKNRIGDENPRRPMTRRFADSLASKSQACAQQGGGARFGAIGNERRKRAISSVVDTEGSDYSTAIDVDEYRLVDDSPRPMVEEMDHEEVKEIEMEDQEMEHQEDKVLDPVRDIDSADLDDPLAVVEYVEQIYDFFRRTEIAGCVSPDYMSHQFDINERMRAILIDWLIEVHYKFELLEETLYLTVNIIDRFLENQSVVRKKLQLVGVTALLLACKYEEVSVPVVEDLILISDRAYTREQVLEMEKLIVNTLQFNMSVPTPYVFMRRFLKAAQSDKKLELLSFFMMELCLVEYQMLKYRPSMLAAAAVYTAQSTLKGFRHWTSTSAIHCNYSEEQLLECSRLMVDFHQKAGHGKLTGVHRKYNTFKFGCAAKAEPARFLLGATL